MVTVEQFIDGYIIDGYIECDLVKLGYIPNKRLSKVIKSYKYIDIAEFWFDDPDEPERNNWIDVEGIGYGWLWLSYKKDRNDKRLRKRLRRWAMDFHEKEEIYYANIDGVHCYWWISGEEIIQVRLSNNSMLGGE